MLTTRDSAHLCSGSLLVVMMDDRVFVPLGGLASGRLEAELPLLMVLAAASDSASIEAAAEAVAEQGYPDALTPETVARLSKHGLIVSVEEPQAGRDREEEANVSGVIDTTVSVALTDVLRTRRPLVLLPFAGGFAYADHNDERQGLLSAHEVMLLRQFCFSATVSDVLANAADPAAGDHTMLLARLSRFVADGLLRIELGADDPHAASRYTDEDRTIVKLHFAVQRALDAHLEAEVEREERTGLHRIPVVPVAFEKTVLPIAIGLIVAHAKHIDDGRLEELYQFLPTWVLNDKRLDQVLERDEPMVFLLSAYVWSIEKILAAAARIRAAGDRHLIVIGGPSAPKYAPDVATFFATYPAIDVIVHGEGEVTAAEMLAALEPSLRSGRADLESLTEVAGLSFRHESGPVTTASRDRIVDLDSVPSPMLSGVFAVYESVPGIAVSMESNRGCPYGCTFCDWGSATLSRLRKFSMERVLAELEWSSRIKAVSVGFTDSNFGIFSRDVEIAEKVAALKTETGYPTGFGVSYAKNTVKHLRLIIESLRQAGIVTFGTLSLQTMDQETLDVIDRSNIKTEKYDALATEFRQMKLPLFIELMMALPGSSYESFKEDLQQCVHREAQARIPITEVLVNSPMNEPEYKEKYRIEVSSEAMDPTQRSRVMSTSTFTRSDFDRMYQLRVAYLVVENLGVLRHVARFCRQELGLAELDLYERLLETSLAEPERWPSIRSTLTVVPEFGGPPVSWRRFVQEVQQFLHSELSLPESSAFDTVLTVQHALLPAAERDFPLSLTLPHDYAAWHQHMIQAKESGHMADWPDVVPALATFGPGALTVSDPSRVADNLMGHHIESHGFGLHWEFETPVARPYVNLA